MTAASRPVLPLNDFQRLMRYWDEFQPFSGIDAIEANEPVDVEKLRVAAEGELVHLGVGLPVASADGKSVSYRSERPVIVVESVEHAGADRLDALAQQCSAELNRSFKPQIDPLIRVWVVNTAPKPYIGMTWQHWPLDGVSAGDLFRRILARYVGAPLTNEVTATDLVAVDTDTLFQPWNTFRRKLTSLRETIHEAYYSSRIFALARPVHEQTKMRVHLLELPHPSRPPGATLNDVVTGALLWAVAEVIPERYRNLWRQRISLISFVDLRPFGGEILRRAWGQFLAFCILHVPEPRPKHWGELMEAVRLQSLRIRDDDLFFGSLGAFRAFRKICPWLPKRWRYSLPYQLTPFTAGLTNTRFRAEWLVEPLGSHFGRSWRIAPLGGLVALTADVCSKGDQLSIALTCEDPSAMGEKISAVKSTMSQLLTGASL